MIIKEVRAKSVKDSRGEKTIQVIVKTSKGKFRTSAPAGKSKGKFEAKSYAKSLEEDIKIVNNLDLSFVDFSKFLDLVKVENIVGGKLGANSLFALEACLLKALARERKKELWQIIGGRKGKIRSVGNSVGGGLHSKGIGNKKPDFQEFLFIANGKNFKECVKVNHTAYKLVRKLLKARRRNDEGAWETELTNEGVLMVMDNVRSVLNERGLKVDLGFDVAASSFFDGKYYCYKNPSRNISKSEQINYIAYLIKQFNLLYVEDGLNENDFSGFSILKKKCGDCLIVGDDLIVTNPLRLKKAIEMKSINAIIVKPNQIGSLLKFREVVELAHERGIKCIISHRSGETTDNTIADLGVGFGCEFIKTGIYGKVRTSKLKRIIYIEKNINRNRKW